MREEYVIGRYLFFWRERKLQIPPEYTTQDSVVDTPFSRIASRRTGE